MLTKDELEFQWAISTELYRKLGFKLINLSGKRPTKKKWNKKRKSEKLTQYGNIGVKLSYSDLCCFDIDNLKQFKKITKQGGYWKLIKQGVQFTSGKKNRLKIIFRCDPLPTIPLGFDCGQFRCATETGLTMQDVLPPSLHPEGTRYQWLSPEFKNWVPFSDMPTIPKLPHALEEMVMTYFTTDRSKSSEHKAKYVQVFNDWAANEMTADMLIHEIGGYTPVLGGWRRNGSANPLAIKVYSSIDAFNFSTTEEQAIRTGPLDLYNLYVIARHDGDEEQARKWVCNTLRKEVDDVYKDGKNYSVEIKA